MTALRSRTDVLGLSTVGFSMPNVPVTAYGTFINVDIFATVHEPVRFPLCVPATRESFLPVAF